MNNRFLLTGMLLAACVAGVTTNSRAESANVVAVVADVAGDTTWYRTNVYLMDGYIHVLAPATLTIEAGTVIKGLSAASITTGESASALFVTAGAKIKAEGTASQPIIFTTEFDDTGDATDMGLYERGLWGGVVLLGKAVLNTASDAAGNTNSPKYDVFEGLPDNEINGQRVYRFGGSDDADNSGVLKYVSIRHGGYQFLANKELNGVSLGAVGSGTTLEHVEVYAFADDGFEFFGGTVNTKYLVSAFNDDDTFDVDQGFRGKNQFWFSIQEDGKRDSGGEWNGEPSGIAVSNAPIANFQLYNATFIGAGNAGTNVAANHGLVIREYNSPRMYNTILTDFTTGNGNNSDGLRIADARSEAMLTAGLLDVRETIVAGFGSRATNARSAILLADAARKNTTADPLLASISRVNDRMLDPRPAAGSPALTSSITPPNDGFFTPVAFKGAFDQDTLWLRGWTTLDHLGFLPGTPAAESANVVTVVADVAGDTTWYRTNVYLMDGYIHVLAPATLTIEAGTVIKGLSAASITTGESASALFVTAGAKIKAEGTASQPIIFTTEFDDTGDATDMGLYERGLWGGVVLLGKAVLNTASDAAGNTNSPKYDVFEGLPDNEINGQRVYRFGGSDDADNSGVLKYVSIRHGGYQFLANKELNGVSLGAVGSGTTLEHVEVYAFADDGFEFFGGTVNTKYLVSAFNDDDTFDVDQGFRGKNQFWFSIQEDGKRDSGGEWNGEPSGIAVSNAPIANFQLYNATFIGAGNAGTNVAANHGLVIREYNSPRMYNTILTDFTTGNGNNSDGLRIADARSEAMLTAGLLDVRETIVAGFGSRATNARSAILLADAARKNTTADPLLASISRVNDRMLDPRPAAGSPALTSSITPPNDGFYTQVSFKGAFDRKDLWMQGWSALDQLGVLGYATEILPDAVTTPDQPLVSISLSGANIVIICASQTGHTYTLESTDSLSPVSWGASTGVTPANPQAGTGGTLTFTVPASEMKFFRVVVQ